MFVIEQKVGLDTLTTILQVKGNLLEITSIDDGTNDPQTEVYKGSIESIARINHNSFVILQADVENVRLLNFEYNGSSSYNDMLLYRENAFDIKKVLCDKNRLYILI